MGKLRVQRRAGDAKDEQEKKRILMEDLQMTLEAEKRKLDLMAWSSNLAKNEEYTKQEIAVERARIAIQELEAEKEKAEKKTKEPRGRTVSDVNELQRIGGMAVGDTALVDLGRPRDAEPLLRESLGLRRQALPPGHWMIASSESVLGACLTAQGRYREAEALLLRALAALETSRGQGYDATVEARRRLVALYEAWGRPDPAAALRDP